MHTNLVSRPVRAFVCVSARACVSQCVRTCVHVLVFLFIYVQYMYLNVCVCVCVCVCVYYLGQNYKDAFSPS